MPRMIDADELYEDMLYEMCGTGYQGLALSVIKRAPTIALPPNDPLTREELRKMEGEPVWCCQYGWKICYRIVGDGDNANMLTGCGSSLSLRGYGVGKTWLAYRRKPEVGTT